MSTADNAYDRVLRMLDGALVVVTAAAAGDADGCLVGFHTQCSIHPRRHALWISHANHTHALVLGADVVAVHALTAAQHALAARFGGETADDVDKMAGVAWTSGPEGVPLLDDVENRFIGRVLDRVELAGGDHTLLVVEPIDARAGDPAQPFRLHDAADIDAGHDP
jgi:flavin reductase (DIM6/NTAB) family NADH-FMN oxidoreductase RutF